MARQLAASRFGTRPGTYLYTLAVASDQRSFATIGSDDSFTIFDLALTPLSHNPDAHAGVTCLSPLPYGFATAGRNGSIRCWDPRAKRTAIELFEPNSNGLSSIACHGHIIAAGTESTKEGLADVSVLIYDTRNPGVPVRQYNDSHTDTITQLNFHPVQQNVVLSGSEDGLVSLFDINVAEEEDALQQVLNPRSGVHHAGFLNDAEVYVLTADENFLVYSLPETNHDDQNSVLDVGDVRAKLDCTYIVDILPNDSSTPLMAYGHHENKVLGLVQLDPSRSYGFAQSVILPGAHADEVVRDLRILNEPKCALSCGEDGHVKVWDLSPA